MFWNTAVPSRPLRLSSQPVFMKLRHAGVFYLAPPADFGSDQREATRNVAGGRKEGGRVYSLGLSQTIPLLIFLNRSLVSSLAVHTQSPHPLTSPTPVTLWMGANPQGSVPAPCQSSIPPNLSQAPGLCISFCFLQHSSYLRGQPQRTSLSSSGCCAPALTVSAPIVIPAARLGSARRLKRGALFPEPHQCSQNAEFGQMDRGSTRLSASETLPSLGSVVGLSSGPSRIWKEGALLDSPMGGWTKRGQGAPRGTGDQDSGESPGRTGCLSRQGKEEGCVQTRSHVFKNNSAVSSGETI